ncbi:hypothetical protein [Fluviispira multicolorata]|uniref:Uncharacterized protein n=1 Tax=Fluviispira multicolorata TaxID=2654512 RepID=A0A833N826_9BACT|nr:hypothetical protein [Fluviispira multicolorata]KAB8033566.1 hypothetical protein GCL57_02335 [Fluviispira multicolorata]
MNTYPLFSILLLLTFFYACGKETKVESKKNIVHLGFLQKSGSVIKSPLESPLDLMQGFNSYVQTVHENCIQAEVNNPVKSISAHVQKLENKNYSELLNTISNSLHTSLPIKISDSSIAMQFAKQSEAHSLSWNYTIVSEIRAGKRELDSNKPKRIAEGLENYFDENGKLKYFYEFMNKCGNEAITKQDLIAKLLITIKLEFDSSEDKINFTNKIGSSIDNLFAFENAGPLSVTLKTKYINSNLKKKTHLSVNAIQFGGDTKKLSQILSSNSSCDYKNIEKCDKTYSNLLSYLHEFNNQFNESDLNSFTVLNSETRLYKEMIIVDKNNRILDFSILDHRNDELELVSVFNKIDSLFKKEKYNLDRATKYFNMDIITEAQKRELLDIINKATSNINVLNELSSLVPESLKYINSEKRLMLSSEKRYFPEILEEKDKLYNIKARYDKFRSEYSTEVLENFIIAKGNCRIKPANKFKLTNLLHKVDRVCQDISQFKTFFNLIGNESFKSFEFLLKSKDGKIIDKGSVDIYCNIPAGRDKLLFKDISSGFNPLFSSFESFKMNGCNPEYGFYAANPKDLEDIDIFTLEVIGKT